MTGRAISLFTLVLVIAVIWSPVGSLASTAETRQTETKSVVRLWNEALLLAIRNDYARPTVHARNLYHSAAASFDIWAILSAKAPTLFVGAYGDILASCRLSDKQLDALAQATTHENLSRALSHAQLRLLQYRFADSPGQERILSHLAALSGKLGLDTSNFSTNVDGTTPFAALGNKVAECIIDAGMQDGSNESNNYSNTRYRPINLSFNPNFPGVFGLSNPNRWQSLQLDEFIDQSGNASDVPEFIGAEWGKVTPFALEVEKSLSRWRDDAHYRVYHDPGPPALLDRADPQNDAYQWGHSLVAIWSSHLDPSDGVMWDISPASLGNSSDLHSGLLAPKTFYQRIRGGSTDRGYTLNPATGKPYQPHVVPRGDYTRVLAEFWADGPDSETPPGHWFRIYNEAVSDHEDFDRRWQGRGQPLDALTFDILAYLALGGAMHDSAISAWSIKGYYDYVRPLSALRFLSTLGQKTDPGLPGYHPMGIPLEPGLIELVTADDTEIVRRGRHNGKVKVRAWRGPKHIDNPETDTAGVGWILLEEWMPYQRPNFVTPPFAGYVSGHSTFSRAAAEILTLVTGNPFFPGGLAEFIARKNNFLVFEQGPSVDVHLQWATYHDAADQTSLSRIWGGIHPPVDDLPGRKIGVAVARGAFDKVQRLLAEPVSVPVD